MNLKLYRFTPIRPDGILQELYIVGHSENHVLTVVERIFKNHWYVFDHSDYRITSHDIFEGQYFVTAPIPKK